MIHRLSNILAGLSLLLCVATLALWVTTYETDTTVRLNGVWHIRFWHGTTETFSGYWTHGDGQPLYLKTAYQLITPFIHGWMAFYNEGDETECRAVERVVRKEVDVSAPSIPFDTHDGYFVINKFEPDAPASFVVLQDQKAFDKVFGSGFVMNDKHHRLPKDAFESKMVVAAIKRGKAVWTYKVETLTINAGILTLGYITTSEAHPSAEFACPLIVSIPKGDYLAVQFVEDGKVVKKIDLAGARPAEGAGDIDVGKAP